MAKLKQETYTHAEAEKLINSIIHQASFGDVHYYGARIMADHGMTKADPANSEINDDEDDQN